MGDWKARAEAAEKALKWITRELEQFPGCGGSGCDLRRSTGPGLTVGGCYCFGHNRFGAGTPERFTRRVSRYLRNNRLPAEEEGNE